MMRDLRDEDVPALREMYERKGLDRHFPDVIACGKVFEIDGKPVAMVAAEVIAEIVLVVDRDFDTPGGRAAILHQLYGEVSKDLQGRGIKRGVAWIHEKVNQSFPRRIAKAIGWRVVPEKAIFGNLGVKHE